MQPRIAHVISTRGIAGAERFLGALVERGEADGWEQLVLNLFGTDAPTALGELYHPAPLEAHGCDRVREVASTRRWLRSRLDAFAPDVVHVLLFHAAVIMGSMPRRPGSACVVTNVYGEGINFVPHGRLIRLADRWAGRRADHVAAISGSVHTFLVSEYGYPSSKVTCIPLGWAGTPQPARTDSVRPTIICVGGLRRGKGHNVLLSAFALVREQVPNARLMIVGDGELRPSLEAQAAAAGLGECAQFLGWVPDVWSHLAEADVFATASRSEAFGIAIAEAMAAGLPVVGPNVGSIPELVRPGITGELFPSGDHRALAAHLIRLLQSADLRTRMAVNAREAAEMLRMEQVVERYFALFHELRTTAAKGRPSGLLAR